MLENKSYWTSPVSQKTYELYWCSFCNSFSVICSKCSSTSCNCNCCSECDSDFNIFNQSNLHLNKYLTKDELKVLDKIDVLKELILKSSTKGFQKIDFKYCDIYLSKYSRELLKDFLEE